MNQNKLDFETILKNFKVNEKIILCLQLPPDKFLNK